MGARHFCRQLGPHVPCLAVLFIALPQLTSSHGSATWHGAAGSRSRNRPSDDVTGLTKTPFAWDKQVRTHSVEHLTHSVQPGNSTDKPATRSTYRVLEDDVPSFPSPMCKRPGPVTVTISPRYKNKHAWKGWGTSLCWFANFIGGLPRQNLTVLLDLLFSPPPVGLGLNLVRYNIGGGFNAKYSPQLADNSTWMWIAGMPGFKASRSAPYNWSADANQRRVLFGARKRGADQFIAFSNSPPWWMTISGDVAGNTPAHTDNLRPEDYQAFADYLADVVRQYAKNPKWNLTFQFLEPVNEPSGSWVQGFSQEGCHFKPESLNRLFPLVISAVKKRKLATQIVGTDSWYRAQVSITNKMPAKLVKSLAMFHVHGYIRPSGGFGVEEEAVLGGMRELAYRFRKEVWVSEWGGSYISKDQISFAIDMATKIIEAINYLGVGAWTHWQAMDPKRGETLWAFVKLNYWDYNRPFGFKIMKSFHVMQQFTQSAKPGSITIVPVSLSECRHGITSFYTPGRWPRLTVFAVNSGQEARVITLQLTGFKTRMGLFSTLKRFRTSSEEDNAPLPVRVFRVSRAVKLICAPESVTSFVLQNIIMV